MLQNSFSGSVIQAEIISGVQNMDNIILIFPAYRIKGVTVKDFIVVLVLNSIT